MNRNFYGALTGGLGRDVVNMAIKTGKLETEYCDVDDKHRGSALNYDVYDVQGSAALIQRRFTTCTKYGNSPKKDYFMLIKEIRTVKILDMNKYKPTIVKLSKSADELGDVIDCINGKMTLKIKTNRAPSITTGYKQVAVVDDKLFSIFDGKTEYQLGVELKQTAKSNHCGGYYCYDTVDEAYHAVVPTDSVLMNAPRKIISVLVSGQCIKYGNGKKSYSKMCPRQIMDVTI